MDTARKLRISGYAAGIGTGVAYGFNTLFAKNLLSAGVGVMPMLLYRYLLATALMTLWMVARREPFRIQAHQWGILLLLGILFSASSIGLFAAFHFMPAGLATAIVYIYPVFTALIMLFLHQKPGWQAWLSIVVTLLGVVLICLPSEKVQFNLLGAVLSAASALVYAFYLVIVNNNRRIASVTPHAITFYALVTGVVMYALVVWCCGMDLLHGVGEWRTWANLLGLAVMPTMMSMLCLAIATRRIGPTRTAVLGVFEPVTSIFLGWCFFQETLTPVMAAGVLLCMGAVTFMILSGRK